MFKKTHTFDRIYNQQRPLIIGHRGACAVAPENTLASFAEAIRQGADGVECDVQMTKDGELVILHDETLDRTTNGTGFVYEYTYDSLSKLDAGSWFDKKFAGEKIPTLDEFLTLVVKVSLEQNRTISVVIEIKAGSWKFPGIEKATVNKVREYGLIDQALLISYDHPAVFRLKQIAPEIKSCVIYDAQPVDPVSLARTADADYLGPQHIWIDDRFVKKAHAKGINVYAWTIQNPEAVIKLAKVGTDAIAADHPKQVIDYLQ